MITQALLLMLTASPGQISVQRAESILLDRLKTDMAFPQIKSECLYAILDNESKFSFQFSVRFDQSKCGGNSASDLIDRFTVSKATGAILHYVVAGCYTESYAKWLKRERKVSGARLTSPSTPPPPAARTQQPSAVGPVMSDR